MGKRVKVGKMAEVLTIDGEAQTWLSALPMVLKLYKKEDFYRVHIHRCKCSEGACDNKPVNDIVGGEWSNCPYQVLRQGWFQSLIALFAAKDISNLEGWPFRFSAWATSGLIQVSRELSNG